MGMEVEQWCLVEDDGQIVAEGCVKVNCNNWSSSARNQGLLDLANEIARNYCAMVEVIDNFFNSVFEPGTPWRVVVVCDKIHAVSDTVDEDDLHDMSKSLTQIYSELYSMGMSFEYRGQELNFGVDNCCFCLQNFAKGGTLSELPCGHAMHRFCLREWEKHTDVVRCPMCNN